MQRHPLFPAALLNQPALGPIVQVCLGIWEISRLLPRNSLLHSGLSEQDFLKGHAFFLN